MVGFKKGWLSEIGTFIGHDHHNNDRKLGILAFETAKTMSRLVSLYKSLSDDEISRLKKDVIKSQGIAYLNSKDEGFLLSLACAERLEDLDKAANVVARLGRKCKDLGLNRFDLVYIDLKLGIMDFGKLEYGSKETEKKVGKMEKLIASTSGLYMSLEGLTDLEVAERKMKQWKNKAPEQFRKANVGLFIEKLEHQRRQVRHYREVSLWNKTFDKSVGLMARIVCIVYARICAVFGPYIPVLPSVSFRSTRSLQQREVSSNYHVMEPIKEQILPHSGPISSTTKPCLVRFFSRKSILFLNEDEAFGVAKNNRVFHAAGPSTVGGSGLALCYANVILLAEKYMDSKASLDHVERESLYQMLPENLKAMVRAKLSRNMRTAKDDMMLAVGWRDAMNDLLRWLAPMANDTVTWQMERNLEKRKFDHKPSVLLLQTLHFSDKEKTEAAIAEVLVGLSCIYRFENRRSSTL